MFEKKKLRKKALGLVFLALFLAPGGSFLESKQKPALEAMLAKVVESETEELPDVEAFNRLSRLFFDYLESFSAPEVLRDLYQSLDLQQLRTRINTHFGGDVLDFGEVMFAFFEKKAATKANNDPQTWKTRLSEHFIFFYRPRLLIRYKLRYSYRICGTKISVTR